MFYVLMVTAEISSSPQSYLSIIATISKTIGKDFSNTRRRLPGLWTGGKIRQEDIENKTDCFLPRKETEK